MVILDIIAIHVVGELDSWSLWRMQCHGLTATRQTIEILTGVVFGQGRQQVAQGRPIVTSYDMGGIPCFIPRSIFT